MFGRGYISVTREGWLYLAVLTLVFGGALLREINMLILVAGFLSGPLLTNLLHVVFALRRITVTRSLPQSVCAGDLLVVELEIKNGQRRNHWALLASDTIQATGRPAGERPFSAKAWFFRIRGAQTERLSYRVRMMRRGRYQIGPLRVSTRFPFGLLQRRLKASCPPNELIVCPKIGKLKRHIDILGTTNETGSHRIRGQRGMSESGFYGVRDWQSGDSQRWIHWRSSARRGSLMVREFEQERNLDLNIILDLYRPEQAGTEHLEAVEKAVSFAATLIEQICRQGGATLNLRVTGKHSFFRQGPASTALLAELLEDLADVQADRVDHLPEALAEAASSRRRSGKTVVISSRSVDRQSVDEMGAGDERDPKWVSGTDSVVFFETTSDRFDEFFTME